MGPMDGLMGMMGHGGGEAGPDTHAIQGDALRQLLTKIRELMVELADSGVPGAEAASNVPMKGKVTAVSAELPEGSPEEESAETPAEESEEDAMGGGDAEDAAEGPGEEPQDLGTQMKSFFESRPSPLDKKTFQAGGGSPKDEMFKKRR